MLRNILLQTNRTTFGVVARTTIRQAPRRSLFSLCNNRSLINQTIVTSSTNCSNTMIFKRFKRLNFKKLRKIPVEEEKGPEVKMNEQLSSFEKLLLIGTDKKTVGVVSYQEAYDLAKKEKVDLVLVQANATPPVAKLIAPTDKKLQKLKASKLVGIRDKIKEVQFSEVITEHDMQVKITKLRSMLKRQYRVRVRIQFKDRKNFDQELAREIMLNVAARVKDLALRDSRTGLKIEGQGVYSLLVPRASLPEGAEEDEKAPAKTKTAAPAKETAAAPAKEKVNKTAQAAATSAAAVTSSKPHPAEAIDEIDVEEDLAEEMEEDEEGEGDGLADLAPEEVEELLAQLEQEEKNKKQQRRAPVAVNAVKRPEPTKNSTNNSNNARAKESAQNKQNQPATNRNAPQNKQNQNNNARNDKSNDRGNKRR